MTEGNLPANFYAMSQTEQFYAKVVQMQRVTHRGDRAKLCQKIFEEYGSVMDTEEKTRIEEVISQASNPSLEQVTAMAEGTLPANVKAEGLRPADFNAMSLEQQFAVKLVQMRSVTHEDRLDRLKALVTNTHCI